MIPILILAGGASTRMQGQDKLLQDVAGRPLLQLQIERAIATGHPVYVALPSADHPRMDTLNNLDVTPLIVPEAAEGMAGTMRGAVTQLPEVDAFMLLLGDLIDIETDDLNAVFKAYIDYPDYQMWRGATQSGKPGHPVIFSASIRPYFQFLTGDNAGETLVTAIKDRTHLTLFKDDRARYDLDTPQDWAKWRASQT